MNSRPLLIALATLTASLLQAQTPNDLITKNLFQPEFIMANAEAINFTDAQKQALRDTMEKNQERFTTMQRGFQQEAEALGKMLGEAAPPEAAVLAQYDKLQDREREIKRAQFALMLGIRAALTDEQRAKLADLRVKNLRQPPPEFSAKMERVKAALTKWQSEGRDPSSIAQTLQQLQPLMMSGKLDQASALLDEALKALEGGGK